jgi:uncharacterized membrane protein YccC
MVMPDVDRRAFTIAFGCWLATMVALGLHLDDPWWSAITAYRVSNPDQRAQFLLAMNRLVGTIIGCIVGYFLAVQLEDIPSAQLFALFVVGTYGFYNRFTRFYSYAWLLGAVMVVALIAQTMVDPDQLGYWAYYRVIEIAVGVIVRLVVDEAFRPWHSSKPGGSAPKLSAEQREDVMITSAVGGAAVVVIPIIWTGFQLPNLTQVLVTSMAMLQIDFAGTFKKGLLRAGGCLAGGGVGLFLVGFSIDSFWLWSLVLFAGLMVTSLLHSSSSPNAYLGTQAGYGFIMAMVTGSGPPDSIMPAFDRLVGISLGVAIMAVLYLMAESLIGSAAGRARRRSQ